MYKVEHMDTNGVWHKSHRGEFKSYSAALSKRDEVGAYGRIMQKIGASWEQVRPAANPNNEPRGVAFGPLRGEKRGGGFGGPFPKTGCR